MVLWIDAMGVTVTRDYDHARECGCVHSTFEVLVISQK